MIFPFFHMHVHSWELFYSPTFYGKEKEEVSQEVCEAQGREEAPHVISRETSLGNPAPPLGVALLCV